MENEILMKILQGQNQMQEQMNQMQNQINQIQEDVGSLKEQVISLEKDMDSVKQDVKGIKIILDTEIRGNIQNEKLEDLQRLDLKVEKVQLEIYNLKSVTKDTLYDLRLLQNERAF